MCVCVYLREREVNESAEIRGVKRVNSAKRRKEGGSRGAAGAAGRKSENWITV